MTQNHAHAAAGPATHRRRLAIAFGITASILVAEVIGALWTGSLALLVDAGHMLTDAGGLLMALVAASLALRPPTASRTWGWRRAEVLAAGAQATVLLGVGLFALVEGARRLVEPTEVASTGLLVFGVMFWSMFRHRRSHGHQAAQFHEKTWVEVLWTVIPFVILVGMAIPATRTLLDTFEVSEL